MTPSPESSTVEEWKSQVVSASQLSSIGAPEALDCDRRPCMAAWLLDTSDVMGSMATSVEIENALRRGGVEVTTAQLLRPAGVVLIVVEDDPSVVDPGRWNDREFDLADRLGELPDSG